MKTNINPLTQERRLCERAIQIIKSHKKIKRTKLNFALGITTKHYERLHPFLKDNFENIIEYSKVDRMWYYIARK